MNAPIANLDAQRRLSEARCYAAFETSSCYHIFDGRRDLYNLERALCGEELTCANWRYDNPPTQLRLCKACERYNGAPSHAEKNL